MSLTSVAADGTAAHEWERWTCTCRVVVTEPDLLEGAVRAVEAVLDRVESAASRFHPGSEVRRLRAGRHEVSPTLAALVRVGLDAAEQTDGAVVPTLGSALAAIGYDRSFEQVAARPRGGRVLVSAAPHWRSIRVTDRDLTLPPGLVLDLGATAKAWAADTAAAAVARLGTGVLVSLGGDVATAGRAPVDGWQVTVQDLPTDEPQTVTLRSGAGLATSSTAHRAWQGPDGPVHHLLDPRTGAPVRSPWRAVTVAAPTCLRANTATTATLVKGLGGTGWLRRAQLPGRLVGRDGEILRLGGFPGSGS